MALLLENQAIIPIVAVIGLMLYLSKQLKQDVLILVCGLIIALSFEYLMTQLGFINFKGSQYPIWFALLWSALLLTVNTSMSFLVRLPWYLGVVVCAIFAPASYWAGARFDVISILHPLWLFWSVYGLAWGLTFSLILLVNKKIADKLNA